MAIVSYKIGPGTLTLGAVPLDVSCQVRSMRVNPTENVTTEEGMMMLCGETLADVDTVEYKYTLAGTILQDLLAAGVIAWSWTNKGTWQNFVFIPNTVTARKVSGQVRPVPLAIGGDADTRPTTDFEWQINGTPTFAAAP